MLRPLRSLIIELISFKVKSVITFFINSRLTTFYKWPSVGFQFICVIRNYAIPILFMTTKNIDSINNSLEA